MRRVDVEKIIAEEFARLHEEVYRLVSKNWGGGAVTKAVRQTEDRVLARLSDMKKPRPPRGKRG